LLLPLLQDESVNVRKGVRALLAQMREEQEQRNFWARVGDVELTPATAAAKLIGQAMPSEDKQQRLLAIRSLALLNAPESLPYLIDWTKDQDTDIQAVAKKAIADIHQRGATMEPAKKK
jgi:HEAT repeat protein